jgi:hypothetical protein
MLKQLTALAVTAASLGLGMPAAHADAPIRACRLFSIETSPNTFDGVLVGTIVHAGDLFDTNVSIQCSIKVNGTVVDSTPIGMGIGAATTFSTPHFTAGPLDIPQICTTITSEHNTTPTTECFDAAVQHSPLTTFGLVCEETSFIGGLGFNILGLVVIDPDGDVHVLGTTVIDCVNHGNDDLPLPTLIFGG